MRLAIHVRPGAATPWVGGSYGDALIVRVRERAVDGKATQAALAALATALGLRTRDVELISGATSRAKIVDVPDTAGAAMARLRDAPQWQPGRAGPALESGR
jgi:uncharacterized protein YggU (UPF0235/DUF167 family)